MYSFNQLIKFGTDGTTCRVDKDDLCNNKCRTKGVFLAAYNCGIVCGYREIFTAESLSQVTMFLIDMISFSFSLPQYIIYDNACHLYEYVQNNIVNKSERGQKLLDSKLVIDRLHIKNHVRSDCHLVFNANLHDDLFKVNTVVCEETNYWLSGFKYAMKHMNQDRYNFFLFIILSIYNEEKIILNANKNPTYKNKI